MCPGRPDVHCKLSVLNKSNLCNHKLYVSPKYFTTYFSTKTNNIREIVIEVIDNSLRNRSGVTQFRDTCHYF